MNYLITIAATIIALLPVIFIKKYINTKNNIYLLLSLVLYILLIGAYIKLFSQGIDVSTVYTLLQILQILIVFLVGIFYFKENVTRNKILGTIFGIFSVYFLLN
jgi:multidrug transporter EmrE-like cation transporter